MDFFTLRREKEGLQKALTDTKMHQGVFSWRTKNVFWCKDYFLLFL